MVAKKGPIFLFCTTNRAILSSIGFSDVGIKPWAGSTCRAHAHQRRPNRVRISYSASQVGQVCVLFGTHLPGARPPASATRAASVHPQLRSEGLRQHPRRPATNKTSFLLCRGADFDYYEGLHRPRPRTRSSCCFRKHVHTSCPVVVKYNRPLSFPR
jgi:hypothetical protein